MSARLVFNILAICGAASFAGVMLNIGLTLGAYWKGLAPAAFLDWFSANSHLIGRTIPFFVVPTLIGLLASLWIDWNDAATRNLWLAALACLGGIMAITSAYHLPTNNVFASRSIALDQVEPTLNTWLWLHAARITLGLVSAALGVAAIAR
jgi:Anthrone oxygenase